MRYIQGEMQREETKGAQLGETERNAQEERVFRGLVEKWKTPTYDFGDLKSLKFKPLERNGSVAVVDRKDLLPPAPPSMEN